MQYHLKTRFRLSAAECAMLKPGFDTLAVGIANAKINIYPHRHPFDRIDLKVSNIYLDRAHDLGMQASVISARQRVYEVEHGKVNLDLVEIAAALLALRVSMMKTRPGGPIEALPDDVQKLSRKLERQRKTAKRHMEKSWGIEPVTQMLIIWRRYVSWCRYNLLQFRLAMPQTPFLKKRWQVQREALGQMIVQAVAENLHAPLTEDQITEAAVLAKSELRRGRLRMTLLECLGADRAGRDLLFALVQHRFTLVPLAGAEKPHWQVVMERNEKFAASRRVHPPALGAHSPYDDFLDWKREYGIERNAR